MFHSLLRRFRTTGFVATGLFFLYRLAQQLMTLDVTRLVWLEGKVARFEEPTDPSLTFRFLLPADIRKFSSDPSSELDESFVDRLAGGQHFCFAALSTPRSGEQQLAAYAWFVLDHVDAEYNQGRQKNTGVSFSYPDHVAFMYKGWTHPDFRGRQLYGLVNGLAMRSLYDRGITHCLSTMDWTNRAARRSCRKLGFIELELVVRWGWGSWMQTTSLGRKWKAEGERGKAEGIRIGLTPSNSLPRSHALHGSAMGCCSAANGS